MNHRDYTEGHLTMLGWRPTSEGAGGATDGHVVIYSYRTGNGVNVASCKRDVSPDNLLDMWMMSDELFWPIVHHLRYHYEP